jgi:hypothetical protein
VSNSLPRCPGRDPDREFLATPTLIKRGLRSLVSPWTR